MNYTKSKNIHIQDLVITPPDKAMALVAKAVGEVLSPLGLSLRWVNIPNADLDSPDYNPDGNLGHFRLYHTDEQPQIDSKEDAIRASKRIRLAGDMVVRMADHLRSEIIRNAKNDGFAHNPGEAIASCVLSMRHFEDGVMRQGLVLKNIGNPSPYPESKDPSSTKVEPTADNLQFAK